MKSGDRVTKEKVMSVVNAVGTVERVTRDYVVVVWDEVNGYWHYTHEQAKALEAADEGG
jgi:hypothetical protein